MKKAFTLIELLVVIAIIAILAAILFPVFAQAKAAAKKTASLSNQKQNALSSILYSGDVDDMMVLTFYPGCGIGVAPGSTRPNATDTAQVACGTQVPGWPKLIQPYSKNWQILRDPTVGDPMGVFSGPTNTGNNWWFNWSRFAHYGYNWAYLCPSAVALPSGESPQRPHSSTELGAPAETVMFVDSRFYDANNKKWVSGFLVSDPPTAAKTGDDEYWFGGWSQNSPDPRYTGGFNVSWADGHAKFDKLTRLNNDALWDRE